MKVKNITLTADQIDIVLESLKSVAWEISPEFADAKRVEREMTKALNRKETVF
jgi:hypothetical protein|tara:strand:- start:1045 stop:1203 length:159 start_codon:yes stop_codon:yes gene_type:complete